MHFRGPLQLKQFAVYVPSNSSPEIKEKRVEPPAAGQNPIEVRLSGPEHRHQALHERATFKRKEKIKRQEVVATIDGKVVSWENNYFGPTTAAGPVWVTATIDGKVVSWINNWVGDVSAQNSGIFHASCNAWQFRF